MSESPWQQAARNSPAGRGESTRLDRAVLAVILALLAAIALVVLLGDRVGVQLLRTSPHGIARSTSPITIQFSESMNRPTAEERLHIDPPVEGTFAWNGATLIFRLAEAMRPGQEYTVLLSAGAESASGRRVLTEYRTTFTVRRPEVAYLAPSDAAPQNVWIVSLEAPDSPRQATYSVTGIYNFDVSPDGTQIAFAEHRSDTGTVDLKLLDLASGEVRVLLDCPQSDCSTPTWSPDGEMIAYERVDLFEGPSGASAGPTRVWLLDLRSNPPTTRPLFSDSQALGYGPVWSPDGTRVAVFDSASRGIAIYDFTQDSVAVIPSSHGTTGEFSPDGTRLLFPDVRIEGQQGVRTFLQIADLAARDFVPLIDRDDPADDERGAWRPPDGASIAVARRYLDERQTDGRQIYLVSTADGAAEPLIVDPAYYNGFFAWDSSGQQLLVQRIQQAELPPRGEQPTGPPPRPEVWVYDMADGALVRVATNAFHPRWVP